MEATDAISAPPSIIYNLRGKEVGANVAVLHFRYWILSAAASEDVWVIDQFGCDEKKKHFFFLFCFLKQQPNEDGSWFPGRPKRSRKGNETHCLVHEILIILPLLLLVFDFRCF